MKRCRRAGHAPNVRMVRACAGKAVAKALTRNTAVVIASAPGFPHGVVDHVESIAKVCVHMHRSARVCTAHGSVRAPCACRRCVGACARVPALCACLPARPQVCRSARVWLHVDACLGGFVLPFARKLGRHVPAFDFAVPVRWRVWGPRGAWCAPLGALLPPLLLPPLLPPFLPLPLLLRGHASTHVRARPRPTRPPHPLRLPPPPQGVTSMSIDTHKFGLADKGTSCVLYASPEHRMMQFTSITDWSGGLYISPTMVRALASGAQGECNTHWHHVGPLPCAHTTATATLQHLAPSLQSPPC